MNTIIREKYPVAKLPKDLRDELVGSEVVRVTLEPVEPEKLEKAPTLEEIFAENRKLREQGRIHPVTGDEAVARIRALRDAWDD